MAAPQPQGHLGGSRLTRASVSDPTSVSDGSGAASQARRNDGQYPAGNRAELRRIARHGGDALDQQGLTATLDSWVEVASQPSSSSLSSIGDDIVTTGLRVGNQSHPPRRRRLQHHYHQSVQQQMPQSYIVNHATARSGTSSQEEYDETESEEDRLMTSSTENMVTRPVSGLQRSQTAIASGADLSDSDDDDDEGTALGRPSPRQSFRPQPNAFSHPPAHLNQRSYSTNSAIPPHHPQGRPSPAFHRSHNRARPDFRSPSYQADRDEALRASLTTLLSCAAAAKSLPGRRNDNTNAAASGEPIMGAGVGPSTQPMELRLVPESELGNDNSPLVGPAAPKTSRSRHTATRTSSNSSAQSQPASVSSKEEKGKRAASTSQPKSTRATKKKRTSVSAVDENAVTWISPATLTWVLGTGVVLLVSVVGFGAGFVVGREVGRQDILSSASGSSGMGAGMNSTSCGGEVIRSTGTGTLKRWRWGTGMARSVVA